MFADARITTTLERMLAEIEVPPLPLASIYQRASQPPATVRTPRSQLRASLAAVVALAVLFAAFPSRSIGLIQDVEARYRAALQALGGYAPPPAPEAFVHSLTPQSVTLATAQSHVQFAIVPPAGLPKDVVSRRIQTTATGTYSEAEHKWRVDSPDVTFTYHRADGRTFTLLADRYDPHAVKQPKYMFEALDPGPDGKPVIVRHEHFAWRNGNQMMLADEGMGLSAAEIATIRVAMKGIALPRRELHTPSGGKSSKLYKIVAP